MLSAVWITSYSSKGAGNNLLTCYGTWRREANYAVERKAIQAVAADDAVKAAESSA